MLKIRDIMSRDVITVAPDTDITQAAKLLLDHHINGLPVLDPDNKLVGILCQSDLIAQQKRLPVPSLFAFLDGYIPLSSMKHLEKEVEKIAATSVAQAMTPNPITVEPDTTIEAAAALMVDNKFHTLPVTEGRNLVGVVGKEDILRTLLAAEKEA